MKNIILFSLFLFCSKLYAVIPINGVTTDKIANSAVTTDKIANLAITDDKIQTGGLNTASIANAAITKAKLQTAITALSSSTSLFSSTSNTYVDVTNLTVTLTTTGRPVMLKVQPNSYSASFSPYWGCYNTVTGMCGVDISYVRDGTTIYNEVHQHYGLANVNQSVDSSLLIIDTPAAGSHTYKIQGKLFLGSGFFFNYMKLYAIEL